MKIVAIAAVTAGGKTSTVNEIKKRLPKSTSLHFDDYSFDGEVEDFCKWMQDGADYNVWDLTPLKNDIEKIIRAGEYEYLILDYPFAYQHKMLSDFIDVAIFIDTPLDIALARRVLRDMKNESADEIRNEMESYIKCARAVYVQFLKDILPSSDYVIDGSKTLDLIADEIVEIIKL